MSREWEQSAACRAYDPDLWFSDRDRGRAIVICLGCPVRKACLDAALVREVGVGKTHREGIVAGLTGAQRWKLARERNVTPTPTKVPADR